MQVKWGEVAGGKALLAKACHHAGKLAHGLDAANLAVCQGDGDQLRDGRHRGEHVLGVDAAVRAHAHDCVRTGLGAGKDALVLDGVRDHMTVRGGKRQVVGLGRAGGEGHVARTGANAAGHRGARGLHVRADGAGQRVGGGRIVEAAREVGRHGLQDLGVKGSCGGIVQIGRGCGLCGRGLLDNHWAASPDWSRWGVPLSMTMFWKRLEMNSSV